MIRNIYVNNFKTLGMKSYIELKECSFLCGANSSGKSSLIQTLLMLAQTFSSRYQDDSIILNGTLARLGSFIDIKKHNSLDDTITVGFTFDVDDAYYFRDNSIDSINCEFIIGKRDKSVAKIDEEFHPIIISAKYYIKRKGAGKSGKISDFIHFKCPDSYYYSKELTYDIISFDTSENIELKKRYPNLKILNISKTGDLVPSLINIEYDKTKKISYDIISILVRRYGSHSRGVYFPHEEDFGDEIIIPKQFSRRVSELIAEERNRLLDEFDLPNNLLDIVKNGKIISENYFPYSYDKNKLSHSAKKLLNEIKGNFIEINYSLQSMDIPTSFLKTAVRLEDWKKWLNELDEKKRKNLIVLLEKHKDNLQAIWYNNVEIEMVTELYHSSLLQDVENAMAYCFSRSLKYLGPLRHEPQAVYSSSPYDTNTVGLKGEFTASLLHRYRSKYINYASPSVINNKVNVQYKYDTLNNACKEWLSFLGVVEEVRTSDKGKLGYELYVKTSEGEKWQDLTHVGVGVSQVLPIVLMFLNSERSDVLIFEQPELHLHPKVQSKLCDLFLIMANTGRQCIIETHSEYMINRLRLRVAQDSEDNCLNKSALYFINKVNGISEFQNITINKYGAIPKWPEDFFDQTDKEVERILMEASIKKNKEKTKRYNNDSGY
ncbi:DUF3696 domain-containing protein [Citrobacter freundii]|uniref:DUF3696 domain-containing protein n=1 Tax=Citrobacter freundii TaxID=546 RepID=UPI00254B71F8|nr:DUF3696 domain-containing protein [Citrobacter freundii]MDK8078793.1 DUF3696 domain-containing protein [Citrobacter freundii]MDK8590638.1 DUF3696 domain-containing protein [Citrobacter freundii]